MVASKEHVSASSTRNVLSRQAFVKSGLIALVGAGVGLGVGGLGQPLDGVQAAEPLVETCEDRFVNVILQLHQALIC